MIIQEHRRTFMILISLIAFLHVIQRYPSYVSSNQTQTGQWDHTYNEDEEILLPGQQQQQQDSAFSTPSSVLQVLKDLSSLLLRPEEKRHAQRNSLELEQKLEDVLLEFLSNAQESSISHIYTNYTHEKYSSIFQDMSTPQGKAFHWMVHVDEYHIKSKYQQPLHVEAILQRYVLILLFFATEGRYNYRLGNRFTPDANTKAKWSRIGTVGFLSKHKHECHWNKKIKSSSSSPHMYFIKTFGVVCNNAATSRHGKSNWEVTEIHLGGISLDGYIPEELGLLTGLEKLVLRDNYLKGRIPKSLGGMTHLKVLDLSGNQFMGSIPIELGSLVQLESLFLQSNRFHGSRIPAEICHLLLLQGGNLKEVWMDCSHDVDPMVCDCCTRCF
jgi:Leucine-rich repeat (LRR) protein